MIIDINLEIVRALDKYVSIAYEAYRHVFKGITFDTNLKGRIAGKAWDSHISLNNELLEKFPNKMLEETLPHEIAHCVARQMYGAGNIKPHGKEWKHVMYLFGVEPSRCHSMPTTPARKTRKYAYTCGCSVYNLSTVRHKQLLNSPNRFTCKKCTNTLILDL